MEDSNRIDPPKRLCGRVVNIVIWEESHWELVQKAKECFGEGKFVRVKNIKEVCVCANMFLLEIMQSL